MTPVGRMRKEVYEFKANLGYVERLSQNLKNKNKQSRSENGGEPGYRMHLPWENKTPESPRVIAQILPHETPRNTSFYA